VGQSERCARLELAHHTQLQANFTGVYTHNRAHFKTREDNIYTQTSDGVWHSMHNEHATTSKIDDIGYRTAFDFRPNPHHHIRFGHDYTFHLFRPQTNMRLNYADQDTLSTASSNKHRAHEVTAYAEDQITLSDHWTVNGGLHFSLFATNGKTFSHLDPRLALKYQLNPRTSLKASYTQMTQYVHKISNPSSNLPTDYWVPTTERLHPHALPPTGRRHLYAAPSALDFVDRRLLEGHETSLAAHQLEWNRTARRSMGSAHD